MISGVIANWDIISRKYKLINKEINFSWRLFELLNWQFTVGCKITTQNTKFRLLNTSVVVAKRSRKQGKAQIQLAWLLSWAWFLSSFRKWSQKHFCSPRPAYKNPDIWHVRYRRLNSRAFAKSACSRDFLPFPSRVACKTNQSSWSILPYDFSKWRKASKIVSGPKKKKSIWSHCGPKSHAYLM